MTKFSACLWRLATGAVLAAAAAGAHAIPLTYIFTGSAWGDLDGASFRRADITVTLASDTTSASVLTAASVTIAGFGTSSFTGTGGYFFYNPSFSAGSPANLGQPGVGFGYDIGVGSSFDLLGTTGAALAGYVLGTAYGPVAGDAYLPAGLSGPIPTSGGTLSLSHYRNATFTALTSAVPEPTSLALLAFGLAGLGVAVRRRPQA